MKTILKISTILIIANTIIACQKNNTAQNIISVSIYPQKYFVQKIVGDKYKVNVMIPHGASPATYEPTPGQMIRLNQSKMYIKIGHIPFETVWLKDILQTNRSMIIVNSFDNVELIKSEHHHHHETSENVNPHIWLSPQAVKIQIKHILDAISLLDSENKIFYKNNYLSFIAEINTLDIFISNKISQLPNKKFMIFHPSLTYFARDYGLTEIALEVDGKIPGIKDIKKIIDTAKQENIKTILVQKEFDSSSAKTITKSINGKIVIINPLSENWSESLKNIANNI